MDPWPPATRTVQVPDKDIVLRYDNRDHVSVGLQFVGQLIKMGRKFLDFCGPPGWPFWVSIDFY
jgi:hypothetical protein